jgi:hypothetical protein
VNLNYSFSSGINFINAGGNGGNASPELNIFNVSFHIMAGMEYPLAGNNNFIFGIGFDNNLFDITRDNGDQPTNVVTQKMLSFRLGMTF